MCYDTMRHMCDSGINQTAIDEANSAMFKWNVKESYNLTDDNETYYSMLSFKEMDDAASTKCMSIHMSACIYARIIYVYFIL
jgi:hypothetical protein